MSKWNESKNYHAQMHKKKLMIVWLMMVEREKEYGMAI